MAMGFPGLAYFYYGLGDEEYELNARTLFAAAGPVGGDAAHECPRGE